MSIEAPQLPLFQHDTQRSYVYEIMRPPWEDSPLENVPQIIEPNEQVCANGGPVDVELTPGKDGVTHVVIPKVRVPEPEAGCAQMPVIHLIIGSENFVLIGPPQFGPGTAGKGKHTLIDMLCYNKESHFNTINDNDARTACFAASNSQVIEVTRSGGVKRRVAIKPDLGWLMFPASVDENGKLQIHISPGQDRLPIDPPGDNGVNLSANIRKLMRDHVQSSDQPPFWQFWASQPPPPSTTVYRGAVFFDDQLVFAMTDANQALIISEVAPNPPPTSLELPTTPTQTTLTPPKAESVDQTEATPQPEFQQDMFGTLKVEFPSEVEALRIDPDINVQFYSDRLCGPNNLRHPKNPGKLFDSLWSMYKNRWWAFATKPFQENFFPRPERPFIPTEITGGELVCVFPPDTTIGSQIWGKDVVMLIRGPDGNFYLAQTKLANLGLAGHNPEGQIIPGFGETLSGAMNKNDGLTLNKDTVGLVYPEEGQPVAAVIPADLPSSAFRVGYANSRIFFIVKNDVLKGYNQDTNKELSDTPYIALKQLLEMHSISGPYLYISIPADAIIPNQSSATPNPPVAYQIPHILYFPITLPTDYDDPINFSQFSVSSNPPSRPKTPVEIRESLATITSPSNPFKAQANHNSALALQQKRQHAKMIAKGRF